MSQIRVNSGLRLSTFLKSRQAQNGRYLAYRVDVASDSSALIIPASLAAPMTCDVNTVLSSPRLNRNRSDWFDIRWLVTYIKQQCW